MNEIILVLGKADFVKRKTLEGIKEICLCKYNVDDSSGCISQVPPSLLKEVVENHGKYSKGTKDKWMNEKGHLPDLRCDYCYAKRKNNGNIEPRIVGEKTRKSFEEKKPQFVRIGKDCETGHALYRKNLIKFLDLCNEYNAKVIFTTKMLNFDKEVAKRIIENQGVLSFSFGNNKMEKGCCAYKMNNAKRLDNAKKYLDYGVHTLLTMDLDITDSIENNEKRGFYVKKILESIVEDVKRIIPMRLISAKVALITTGIEWQDLINPFGAVGHMKDWEKYSKEVQKRILTQPYIQRGNSNLIANYVHPDFKWFEENLRICGQVGEYEYCDKCDLLPDRIKFPVSEIVKVKYTKKDEKGKNKLQNSRRKIKRNRRGLIKNKGIKKRNPKELELNFKIKE